MKSETAAKEFCPLCLGYGGHWEGCRAPAIPLCNACEGRGWYWSNEEVTHQLGTDTMPVQKDCSVCEGTGKRTDGETMIAPECAKGCQQAADYGVVGSCIPRCVYLERARQSADEQLYRRVVGYAGLGQTAATFEPVATPAQGGYVTAFYELAALMGVPAQSMSPEKVWQEQMLPKLRDALAVPAALAAVVQPLHSADDQTHE